MIIRTCNGCRHRIAEDDRAAMRDVQQCDEQTGKTTTADYCGTCTGIIRAELPRLAAAARVARLAAAVPVHHRARDLWAGLATRVERT
jgi:hypothetical protein